MYPSMQTLVRASGAGEVGLPPSPPLMLTRHFSGVLLFCLLTLAGAPLLIAWAASILLPT